MPEMEPTGVEDTLYKLYVMGEFKKWEQWVSNHADGQVKIYHMRAPVWRREDTEVEAMRLALGLTPEEVDSLFVPGPLPGPAAREE